MSHRDEPPDWALPAWDAIDGPGPGSPRPSPAATVPAGTFGLRVLSVSDVTRAIRENVRADARLREVWVEGEVGRVTVSSAGHAYFSLKDERAQLQCVWFRDDRLGSAFEAQAGLRVVAHGRIDLYEPSGALQLYVAALQPAGFGDLALRFEALKAKLAAEGLFDATRKRPLPTWPATIGVATSASGAVWHDIRTVLGRRWPMAGVLLAPCRVQGDAAPASIVGALDRLDRWARRMAADGRPDDAPAVVILARGGGSMEDLWPFNDERVVRAVVAHSVPIVTGVGHETDVTLADFAADVRAATPSAAAELVVPDRREVALAVAATGRRGARVVGATLADRQRGIVQEARVLAGLAPAAQLAQLRERAGALLDRASARVTARIDDARSAAGRLGDRASATTGARLDRATRALAASAGQAPALTERRLATARRGLDARAATLLALGPQATLDRGYAIVRTADGGIVRTAPEAPAGSRLAIRVARAELGATVDVARPVEDGL